jgi:hypothetical protein
MGPGALRPRWDPGRARKCLQSFRYLLSSAGIAALWVRSSAHICVPGRVGLEDSECGRPWGFCSLRRRRGNNRVLRPERFKGPCSLRARDIGLAPALSCVCELTRCRGGKARLRKWRRQRRNILHFTARLCRSTSRRDKAPEPKDDDWRNEFNVQITRELVQDQVQGCGQYRWINSDFANHYRVQCTADGRAWGPIFVITKAP